MLGSQWVSDIAPALAVVFFTAAFLGFGLAALRLGRKAAELSALREQDQHALDQAESSALELQAELRNAQEQIHRQQLSESRLQEQIGSATTNIERLSGDLVVARDELIALNGKLGEATERRHTVERHLETAQAEGRALKEQLDDVRSTVADQRAEFQQLQERYQSLSNEHTGLTTTLERREEHFEERLAQVAETRQSLAKEFENLANRIFEEKGKTFTHTSQASIDNLLKPFREQIDGFQKRINEVHDISLQGNAALNAEIKKILETGLQMSREANNLTSALKGDSQQRGAWGEAQLRRTLEMSGLVENAHYEVQSSFKDREGKNRLTDYLVKLPDGKHIIIDSKVSLVAYDRAVSAEAPDAYQQEIAEHANAVRRHIDDLASKDYTNLIGVRSPSFVLMFMPIEPAYIEALKNKRDLFEYGYRKNIVLVSHTTLIPILRTVANLWMMERSNTEAREISERAGEIYNQVCLVAERLNKLGNTLNTVSNHYNGIVTALAGQQGLYGKVERFGQLSAKVSKTLPQLEPAHMDFETERLSLIVEPLEEAATPQLEYHEGDGEAADEERPNTLQIK